MSNYNFSVTLDGLNNIDANDIETDNIVTDYLTVNKNSSVPLVTPYTANTNQIASCAFVQDAFINNLANYALLNPVTPQIFTGSQNFPTQATTNNTTLVATTAYVKNNLLNYALLGSANIFTANNRFTSNSANLAITLQNTDVPTYFGGMFIASANGQYNANTLLGDTVLMSTGTGSNTGALSLTTWSSTNCGIRIGTSNISYNGTNHNFNGNISLALYNFDVLNTGRTRGLRIANNGTNNGITDFSGVGVSTRFNFFSNNGSGVASNNFYIFNGDTCYLQGATGLGIGLSGANITLDGICSFTNTTTPIITQAISVLDNSTKIATTAFVKTNLLDYVTLSTNQTITGNKTFNGTTTLNNFFVSNYVDLTLTTYENQFYGDIYGYRGVVCQDGFYVKDSPGPGANTYALIDSTGNISTTTTISATGNISSSSAISCTGILSSDTGLNIPSTSPVLTIDNNGTITQTSTGTNNLFNTTFTSTDNQIRIKAFANTAPSTIAQSASSLVISAVTNNTGATLTTITLATRSSTNTGVVILTGNANNITIGSNTTNTNISSTNIVCNGITSFTNTTTPTITQPILLTDNSTKIATTAFVKGQSYLIASDLTPYALLTPSANPQVFTGQQKFRALGSDLPISIGSTTAGIVGGGGLYVATAAGQYNPIVKTNDCVLLGVGGAIDSANTKLTLTTYASSPVGIQMDIGNMTFDGGIIRQNSPFNCGYSYLGTPVTVKGFYDIGYVWTIPYASFTGTAWATSTAIYNILTLPWDGSGNKKLGVWRVDVVIINTCTSAPSSSLCWNTISNTNRTINDTCVGASDIFLFGSIGCQNIRMSFTINVVNLTTTYFLNSLTGGGSGLASNTASNITFTRIA